MKVLTRGVVWWLDGMLERVVQEYSRRRRHNRMSVCCILHVTLTTAPPRLWG